MPEPFERLDEAMNRRRLELRLNWRELAQAADISYEALRAIRRGDYRPTELTARRLDEALQWEHGSVLAVLDGGEPTPVGVHVEPVQSAPPGPSYDDAALTDALIEKVLADLPPERREAVLRHHLEQVRRQSAPPGESEGERHTG